MTLNKGDGYCLNLCDPLHKWRNLLYNWYVFALKWKLYQA